MGCRCALRRRRFVKFLTTLRHKKEVAAGMRTTTCSLASPDRREPKHAMSSTRQEGVLVGQDKIMQGVDSPPLFSFLSRTPNGRGLELPLTRIQSGRTVPTCIRLGVSKVNNPDANAVIQVINRRPLPVVFLLWGTQAQRKGATIDSSRHCVLAAPHPSPLSAHRGFLGCRHFSAANEFLMTHHRGSVDWCRSS